MVSQLNGSGIRNAYSNTIGESKKLNSSQSVISKQGDTSKIETIKSSIDSGEYKIDLEALSRKIADELM